MKIIYAALALAFLLATPAYANQHRHHSHYRHVAHRHFRHYRVARPFVPFFSRLFGTASFYTVADNTPRGSRVTASGIPLRDDALTAAHRTLPFGTRVRVTNKRNNRSVIVTITDRGPAVWTHRIIDLSLAAARSIGLIDGLAPVHMEVI